MKNSLWILTIIIILSVTKEYQLKPLIGKGATCGIKDVLAIIKTNTDLIFQQIESAGSTIEQECNDAKQKIDLFMEAETISKILVVMQATLGTFQNSDECTKAAQAKFNAVHSEINTDYDKCNSQSKNNEAFLQHKTESTPKWVQSAKVMTGLVLQKCAMKNLYGGCSSLKSCCLEAIGVMTNKIIETTKNSTDTLQSMMSKQNDCFNSVTKDALKMQTEIQEEIFKCSFREIEALGSEGFHKQNSDESTEQTEVVQETTSNSIALVSVQKPTNGDSEPESKSEKTVNPTEPVETNNTLSNELTGVPEEGGNEEQTHREI